MIHDRFVFRRNLGFILSCCFLIGLGVPLSHAHRCGESRIFLEVGRTAAYRITADVSESEPSHYNMSINSDPNIATASPDNMNAFNYGEFIIKGVNPGTNQFVFEWSYEPTQGAGFCVVEVVVVARGSLTQTAANQSQSGYAGDPVNTFTGEFVMQEREDLQLFGPMPLFFGRYYASGLRINGEPARSLGPNWSHNFDFRLRVEGDSAEVVTDRGQVITFAWNGTAWLLEGGGQPYQLVKEGDLFVFGDPREKKVYLFDGAGQLIKIEDGKGNAHTLTYTGSVLTSVADGLGRELSLAYFGLQQLLRVSAGTRTVGFSYGGNLELRAVRNPLNEEVTYLYEQSPQGLLLTTKRFAMGNSHYTNTFGADGRIRTQRDTYGNSYTYNYEIRGLARQTTVTNPLGGEEQHVHNDKGELTQVIDEAGKTIELGYDQAGNRARIQDREGGVTLISYHSFGKPAAVTNADNSIVRYSYTPRNYRGITFHDVGRVDYPDQTSEIYNRDDKGNVLAFTTRQGGLWEYTYNERGQVLTAKNPAGGIKTYTYATNGMLASITTGGGTAKFEYDAMGRLSKEEHADGTMRTFQRDLLDRVTRMTNELGGIEALNYDANGNLRTRQDAEVFQHHEHQFDLMDRLVRFISPGGVHTDFQYDPLGRTARLIHNGNRTNEFTYDAVGNVVAVQDPEGSVWRSVFDAEGVMKELITPLNKTNRYESDAMGRVVAFTSAGGNTRRMGYDPAGRLQFVMAPDETTTTLEYEKALLKAISVGNNSMRNNFSYNALGRETELQDPAGGAWKQEFDPLGRRSAIIDPLGRRTEYEYDIRGRASRVTFPGNLGSVQLQWDGLNAITQRNYSDGMVLDYEYDVKGHLTAATGVELVRDEHGEIMNCNGLAIMRNAQNRVETVTYAPGKSVTYTYNKRGQVQTVTDWIGGVYTFDYDAAGRLVLLSRPDQSSSPTKSWSTFDYDDENRLSVVAHTNQVAIYPERDASGQVSKTSRSFAELVPANLITGNYTYDLAAQPTGNSTSDALGRITSDGVRTFQWNLASRLVEMTEGGLVTRNDYDAFGQRTLRRKGAEERRYVWNYAMGIPAIYLQRDGAGSDRWYYIYTPGGLLLAAINATSNERYFYFFDENGNTLSMVDNNGTIVNRYIHGPFGEPLGSVEGVENPFTFQGKYGVMHEGNGLYYMRARWYDSRTCRFLSRDPLKSRLPEAVNPYQYAVNNPVRYNDPLGLQAAEGTDGPATGETPTSNQDAVRQKGGSASTTGEEDPVDEGPSPSSGVVYLTHEEWNTEVRRVKQLLQDRVKKAEWGWVDPQVPANFDSGYLRRQRERFYFRGLVMNGGELNYYFQGMYWKELGVPKEVMIGIIFAYKKYKYGGTPSMNDLYAACHGYEDNANIWTEMRDEAKHYAEVLEAVPEALGEVIIENGSALVDLIKPWVPSFGK